MFSTRTAWTLKENRLTEALAEVRRGGAEVLDLSASNPTRLGLRYDEDAVLAAFSSARSLDYNPQPKGILEARQAITQYYHDDHGLKGLDAENIVLTTSTSEGYSHVFRLLCNPGDELLVPKPSYPLFEFLADLQDVKLVPYPLLYDHGWQLDFHSLEKVLSPRTRGVVIVHPNNPTGSYVHSQERDMLNEFCGEHDLALIVDEVFLDYAIEAGVHPSFAGNQQVLTFTLSGLSKVSALPQMKLAWIFASGPRPDVVSAMSRLEVIADTYLSMNAPTQWAFPTLLEQRKAIQPQLRARIGKNLEELDRQLPSQPAVTRLRVEGGWNVVLRVPVVQSDEELAIALLRRSAILVHPGHFYDFPSDGYIVLSLIVEECQFAQGVHSLLRFFHT